MRANVLTRAWWAGVWVASRPFASVARARGRRWLALVATECLVAVVVGVGLFIATGTPGLPDVPAPFDTRALDGETLPDDRNASILFEEAASVLTRLPPRNNTPFRRGTQAQTHPDDPEIGRWVDENREALALFLEGAARPDALRLVSTGLPARSNNPWVLQDLATLAAEESARRQARGDLEGAWAVDRALFRAAALIGHRANLPGRSLAMMFRAAALGRVGPWANDPRTTPAQLRAALADLDALDAIAPDDTYTIQWIYRFTASQLAAPRGGLTWWNDFAVGAGRGGLAKGLSRFAVHAIRRVRVREPERSLRVLRLSTTRWIAALKTARGRLPAPEARVLVRQPFQSARVDLFGPAADEPAATRAISARALAELFAESPDLLDAIAWHWMTLRSVRASEQADGFKARVALATALYRRDHNGEEPPDVSALVGPYLSPSSVPPEPIPLADDPTPEIEAAR